MLCLLDCLKWIKKIPDTTIDRFLYLKRKSMNTQNRKNLLLNCNEIFPYKSVKADAL